MLNRTHRTLSAHLNRLNLGTRSLAIAAGHSNSGDLTLAIRPAHRVVMRAGIDPGVREPSIADRGTTGPAIPDSSPRSPTPRVCVDQRQHDEFAAAASLVFAEARPVVSVDCYPAGKPTQTPSHTHSSRGRARHGCLPVGKPSWQGTGFAGAKARTAVEAAVALRAATGG